MMTLVRRAAAAVSLSVAAAFTHPAPATAAPATPPFWCRGIIVAGPAATDPDRQIAAAQRKLCAGDAGDAATMLTTLSLSNAATSETEASHFAFRTTYLYALLAAHRDADAKRYIEITIDHVGQVEPAEAKFLAGHYADSFAAYIADDDALPRNPSELADYKAQKHLPNALADLRAGNVAGAIAEDLANTRNEDLSLLRLMRGNLYAQAERWPDAFEAWAEAATLSENATPQGTNYPVNQWNDEALDMIYAFRAHAPAHQPAAMVACGSPDDLADAELAALTHLHSTDSSRISSASIGATAAGTSKKYANVIIETKGAFTMYLANDGNGWTVLDAPPPNVTFAAGDLHPSACPYVLHVGHPSGI